MNPGVLLGHSEVGSGEDSSVRPRYKYSLSSKSISSPNLLSQGLAIAGQSRGSGLHVGGSMLLGKVLACLLHDTSNIAKSREAKQGETEDRSTKREDCLGLYILSFRRELLLG